MKLSIKGPEKDIVEITKKGDYTLRRIPELGFTEVGYSYSAIEGITKDPKIISRKHTSISRNHLGISIDNVLTLTDNNSSFGSYLDGKKFEKIEIRKNGTYDLKLGNVHFELKYEG